MMELDRRVHTYQSDDGTFCRELRSRKENSHEAIDGLLFGYLLIVIVRQWFFLEEQRLSHLFEVSLEAPTVNG